MSSVYEYVSLYQAGGWSKVDGAPVAQITLSLAAVILLANVFTLQKKKRKKNLVWLLLSLLILHADVILVTPAASCCVTSLLSAHTG